MNKRLKLIVGGRVQGIGYRYAVMKAAQKRGFFGYVRNLTNGTVEIMAEGPEEKLKDFIAWCYNSYRPAEVHEIDQDWSESTGKYPSFVIHS